MLRIIVSVLLLGTFSISAHAVVYDVTPCATPTATCLHVLTNSNLDAADVEVFTGVSMLELFYKQDFGGGETGSFSGSYATEFTPAMGEPTGANITYEGGDKIICPECWLLVKDGSQGNPAQYLFDIGDWDGMMTLALSGFWDGAGVPGSISNVAIWGKTSPVPVPAAVWLFGTALLGFIGFSRRTQV